MKRYDQLCAVARALDVVGERWTLLLVRDLLLGPLRYGEILRLLDGMTTNLLAKRLRDLSDAGILESIDHDGAPAYALTEAGRALEPVILALGGWGARFGRPPQRQDRGELRWLVLTLKRRFLSAPRAFEVTVGTSDETYLLAANGRDLDVQATTRPSSSLHVMGAKQAFRELLLDGVPLRTLRHRGALRLEGDERTRASFVAAFAP